jgi:hypothetical protein
VSDKREAPHLPLLDHSPLDREMFFPKRIFFVKIFVYARSKLREICIGRAIERNRAEYGVPVGIPDSRVE